MKTPAAPPANPRSAPPRRDGFALLGRSHPVDPMRDAVRPDLADVRLAHRIFAPHYAAPLRRVVTVDTDLFAAADMGGTAIVRLGAGAHFDLLDVTGGRAWGVAPDAGLVGYVAAGTLGLPAA